MSEVSEKMEGQVRAKLAEYGLTPDSPDEELREAFALCVAPNKCLEIAAGLRQSCPHDWRRVAFPNVRIKLDEVMWVCLLCKERRITSRWRSAGEVEEHGRVVC